MCYLILAFLNLAFDEFNIRKALSSQVTNQKYPERTWKRSAKEIFGIILFFDVSNILKEILKKAIIE
jgi:hypothetical protein